MRSSTVIFVAFGFGSLSLWLGLVHGDSASHGGLVSDTWNQSQHGVI